MKAHTITMIGRTEAKPIDRLISLGFALCALASAALPALAWTL